MADKFNILDHMTESFFLDIARGEIPGMSAASILGANPDIDTMNEETVWDQGGIYTYLTADTELFISSSSVSDTNVTISIKGMTDDFVIKDAIVVFTSGQTQQSIGSYFRIFSCTVVGGSNPIGDIYTAESGTLTAGVPDTVSKIKAKIRIGEGMSKNTLFTIPVNNTAFFARVIVHTRKNQDANVTIEIRPNGAPGFINLTDVPSFQNSFELILEPPFPVTEKTDLEFRATTETNNSVMTVNAGYILVDNTII